MSTYTVRTPEDLLAVVPVLIGFQPQESVVMMTFGGRPPFHARIDLPPAEEVDECVDTLLGPVRRHGVGCVAFVLFSDRDALVRAVAGALRGRFRAAGVVVLDVLQAHHGRWFSPLGDRDVPAEGTPYDVGDHPFRAQAVLDGRVVEASRAELADRLRADPQAVGEVAEALGHDPPDDPLDGAALRAVLERHLAAGTVPDASEAARILLAVRTATVRDHAWFGMDRSSATAHVRLWTDLVRRAPDGLVAGAAGVLAVAAWMEGEGALAWCAVDRCLADRPDHSLGRIVAEALQRAVPPLERWDARFPRGRAG